MTSETDQSRTVNTGGGAFVGGNVQAARDFIGRDQTITQSGVQGQDLASLFQVVYGRIDSYAAANPDTDADVLQASAKKIEQEAAKGEQADPGVVKRSLTTLSKLAPDIAEVVVNALTNPGAAVASGIRLVAKAFGAGPDESSGG
jgi:hypothetical protein